MVEDDTFTYHVKQLRRDSANTVVHSLITKERTQKLDLLIHLLSNLTQSLVVCGPEGIGKTMLLNMLQERKTELWQYCFMQGNPDLSFEAVQNQLAKSISQNKSVQPLSMALGRYEGQHRQVVLIVDNAGELVPGLIAAIIQYAAATPVLRVIFALTHDELQVKRGSDRAIDDCHIVEIPTLSEKQCGDFLRYLSVKPDVNVSFKAISENMVAQIYRDTHGVPGRIITELSGLSSVKQHGKMKWILVSAAAVATAGAIALTVQWLKPSALTAGITPPSNSASIGGNGARLPGSVMQPRNTNEKIIASASGEQKTDNSEIVSPGPESQIVLSLPLVQPDIDEQGQVALTHERNEAKGSLAPPVETKTSKDEQRTLRSESETASTVVALDLPVPPPLEDKQEKELPALGKTADAGSSAAKKTVVKAQAEPVNTVGGEQRFAGNKQAEVAPAGMAERLWAKQEKLKQEELNKKINGVDPLAANNLQTPQLSQKSIDAATVPQQTEPEKLSVPSANNFTLQLMVLSKQSSVDGILNKYPSIKPGLRVVNTMFNGQQKFILEYGSYPDSESASNARQSLPFEFRDALIRKTSPAKHR